MKEANIAAGGRVRSALVRMHMLDPAKKLPEAVGHLTRTARTVAKLSAADIQELLAAYQIADTAHAGQRRKSGEPYIFHPVAVTQLLAELGMPLPVLQAGLLHDVVEDTATPLEDLTERFGADVAHLVDGVTKIDRLDLPDNVRSPDGEAAATLRKLVLSMATDLRVLVIKLADRLHNMRTIAALPTAKQRQKAAETLAVYAPLAHRLGMQTYKRELEDRSFAILEPDAYREVTALIASSTPDRTATIDTFTSEVQQLLSGQQLQPQIEGRAKHAWSVYRKMTHRGVPFDEIMDLLAVRILVATELQCYQVLGMLHAAWTPIPGRFKDYIATPRPNRYQSLHTVVLTEQGTLIEVQIRTHEMHHTAEWGVAAHYAYKHGGGELPLAPEWLEHLAGWQHDVDAPDEYLATLHSEVATEEVYVLTPAGAVKALPAGATPVDFAYSVHTEVGHRCIGAKVNGKLCALDTPLASGDQVEILTSPHDGAGPSQEWLHFVASQNAHAKIRGYFNRERRQRTLARGKDELARELRRASLPPTLADQRPDLDAVSEQFGRATGHDLLRAVGSGEVSARSVAQRLRPRLTTNPPPPATRRTRDTASRTPPVLIDGQDGIETHPADCCQPHPPDDVTGYVTRGRGVTLHRSDCPNLAAVASTNPGRTVPAEWEESGPPRALEATVEIVSIDRTGLVRDVSTSLAELDVHLRAISTATTAHGTANITLTVNVSDRAQLAAIADRLNDVAGILTVEHNQR